MMTKSTYLGLVLVLTALLLLFLPAQITAQSRLLPGSRVWVEGTSSKNDWSVEATELSGSVALQPEGALGVREGRFAVPAGGLKSGRSPIMDRLMYGALKRDEHPAITYELISAEAQPTNGGATFDVATRGRLSLAGVTKEIASTVQAERLPDGGLRFTGSYPLLMSDYGMTPPSAMMGALRVGDRVVVNFDLRVQP